MNCPVGTAGGGPDRAAGGSKPRSRASMWSALVA